MGVQYFMLLSCIKTRLAEAHLQALESKLHSTSAVTVIAVTGQQDQAGAHLDLRVGASSEQVAGGISQAHSHIQAVSRCGRHSHIHSIQEPGQTRTDQLHLT